MDVTKSLGAVVGGATEAANVAKALCAAVLGQPRLEVFKVAGAVVAGATSSMQSGKVLAAAVLAGPTCPCDFELVPERDSTGFRKKPDPNPTWANRQERPSTEFQKRPEC